jgi:NAD(P)-dependent dehydrogenase (short-subunit alcohol dehydrogenase family)
MSSPADLFRFDNKVALVTGGYGGIGSSVSRGLAALGAKVAVAGHNLDKARACAENIGGFPVAFDALSVADTHRMANEVTAHYGRIDILVNCVGMNTEAKAEEFEEERWDYIVDANLKATMFQAQAAARHMIAGGGGKQVHMGSVRTQLGVRGRGYAAYCAAKGGVAALCRQLAAEWAPHKINVNVVAPTFVRTELVAYMLEDPKFYNALVGRIPLGRIAEPEDVRNTILFFVSPAADFITGQTLYLDGGLTATQ